MAAASLPPTYSARRPLGPRLLGTAAVVALIAGIWWASTQQATVTRKAAEDSVLIPVVSPPPPPPPPNQPKPIEKPEEVPPPPNNQPQPTPQQPSPQPQTPSPGQAVSIDGPAQAGGDAFNIGSGPGGGMTGGGRIGTGIGGFNRAAYANYLEGEIRRAVSGEPSLRIAVLKTKARLWIDKSGRITRVEVGDTDQADAIRDALTGRTVRAPDPSLAMPVQLSLEFRRNG
ncbi:hypothetical protein NDN01_18240 [Sphingomonas sp. QA11]|uniref:hypothetical protein n=1 Tax=Sphingomonas sp. QA11 TaxID=2950605 RepID=UPI0023499F51|nr:hypothetical protein [Sphingomonas sp. QA11]WCM25951.1 hypothetical protein NDN01_18240 [Sphingomonas sp. QA11]